MTVPTKAKIIVGGLIAVMILIGVMYVLSPAASQHRAEGSLNEFLSTGGTTYKLKSCTPDVDGDGYASCTFGELASMQSVQCTSGIMTYVPLFGSKSCKAQDNSVLKLKS